MFVWLRDGKHNEDGRCQRTSKDYLTFGENESMFVRLCVLAPGRTHELIRCIPMPMPIKPIRMQRFLVNRSHRRQG